MLYAVKWAALGCLVVLLLVYAPYAAILAVFYTVFRADSVVNCEVIPFCV